MQPCVQRQHSIQAVSRCRLAQLCLCLCLFVKTINHEVKRLLVVAVTNCISDDALPDAVTFEQLSKGKIGLRKSNRFCTYDVTTDERAASAADPHSSDG